MAILCILHVATLIVLFRVCCRLQVDLSYSDAEFGNFACKTFLLGWSAASKPKRGFLPVDNCLSGIRDSVYPSFGYLFYALYVFLIVLYFVN